MPDFEIYAPVQLRQKSKQTGQTMMENKNQQNDSRYHIYDKMECNKKSVRRKMSKTTEYTKVGQ